MLHGIDTGALEVNAYLHGGLANHPAWEGQGQVAVIKSDFQRYRAVVREREWRGADHSCPGNGDVLELNIMTVLLKQQHRLSVEIDAAGSAPFIHVVRSLSSP